jgi:Lon protease-like protein
VIQAFFIFVETRIRMSFFLPLFPLNLVAFPGESLNLHIFEPRYKELIGDCLTSQTNFGIPSFVHNKIEFGTEMIIEKLVKEYDDGRMDIKTKGMAVIKVDSFINPLGGKLYAGGEVTRLTSAEEMEPNVWEEMIFLIKELYQSLQMVEDVKIEEDAKSFDVGHHIGLSIEQEYELIQIDTEVERERFIIDHLKKTIPVVRNMEKTKERIKLNGHFKHFDPLNF